MKLSHAMGFLPFVVGYSVASYAYPQAPEVDLLALRVASEACIREFERAALNPQRDSKPTGGWQTQDLQRELLALTLAIESQHKTANSPAVELASMMTLKVATASYHLAANEVTEARKVIQEASLMYDVRYKALSETEKLQLKNLGYAGNRNRLLDTLSLMLTTDRIEKEKIAKTIYDPGAKKLTLWKAESLLPKVQAQLACVLFDLDRYMAAQNTVATKPATEGQDEQLVKESDAEERKGCQLSMRNWSLQTFQVVAAVHMQFLDAKKILADNGGALATDKASVHKPLKFLGAVRIDANGDGSLTQLEVERLHASFSKDYPVEFLTSVLDTLRSIEKELESAESILESRVKQLAAEHGFEGGRTYRVRGTSGRVLYFDFLNYARSSSVVKTNGQVTSSVPCVQRADFYQITDGKEESQYELVLNDAKFLAP